MTRRNALISVTDKTGVVDFARQLEQFQYRIISTGGTGEILREGGIDVVPVEDWTGFPEMMDGRVKTLHPAVHAGLLARRDHPADMEEINDHDIQAIDMVVVNLYDVEQAVAAGKTEADLMDEVDIGGPTLLRAAAKNHASVAAVSSPDQYERVLDQLNRYDGLLTDRLRKELAADVFSRTSDYDRTIYRALNDSHPEGEQKEGEETTDEPLIGPRLWIDGDRTDELRYGENPHQEGGLFERGDVAEDGFPGEAESIHGKDLSYNNLMDMDAAYRLLGEFDPDRPACTVIKHMIPCGAAVSDRPLEAFRKAHAGDPVSAFGSIVGFNTTVTTEIASHLATENYYIEGLIAPSFEEGVSSVFDTGPGWGSRVRLVPTGPIKPAQSYRRETELRTLSGGYLLQQGDGTCWEEDDLEVVTGTMTDELLTELRFAWIVCKHVRSNAIVIGNGQEVAGVGAGQPSRVDAADIAVKKAGEAAEGGVLASDAFFPFPDALEVGVAAGVRAAVQPGGSVNDDKVIEVAREAGVTMLMTGQRHFRH